MADYIPDPSNLTLEGSHDYSVPDGANISLDIAFGEPVKPPPGSWPVAPSVIRRWQSDWQKATRNEAMTGAGWRPGEQAESAVKLHTSDASQRPEPAFQPAWGKIPDQDVHTDQGWGNGQTCQIATGGLWGDVPPKDAFPANTGWDASILPTEAACGAWWGNPPGKDNTRAGGWFRVMAHSADDCDRAGYLAEPSRLSFVFRNALCTPENNTGIWFAFGQKVPPKPVQPRESRNVLSWNRATAYQPSQQLPWGEGASEQRRDADYRIRFAANTDPVDHPGPTTPDRPAEKDTWLIMNTINTVTLPDRTPLDITDLTISLDIDSFTWSLVARVNNRPTLARVQPDRDGPKHIEVAINGWTWVFMIERYSSDRRFGREQYTIRGESRTKLLATPYAPRRSHTETSPINARQAMENELLNTGFSIDWNTSGDGTTPDWTMDGGVLSYQDLTPMQVIARIATTAGAVVIPAAASDALTIQPRYPFSPWHWQDESTVVSHSIPESMMVSMSAEWRAELEYNAVYVSGTHTGVAVEVTRAGTAGDQPAPDIVEEWLTDVDLNTERGRNELSKGGNQEIVSLDIPLTSIDEPPGLVMPGKLVEVTESTGAWYGLCLSTSIRAPRSGAANVTQTVELERHY